MSRRTLLKLAMIVSIAAAISLLYLTPARDKISLEGIRELAGGLREPWYGPILFILLYAAGCIFAVPATVFAIAAGFLWGWKLGGLYAMLGGMTGAIASFILGRFMGEGLLDRFGRLGRTVTKQVDHAGFKSLLLIRFIPLFPFAVVNYGAGVARVRLSHFIAATAIALVPGTFVFGYCADSLLNGTMTQADALRQVFIVVAVMLSFVLLSYVLKRLARTAQPTVEGAESGS